MVRGPKMSILVILDLEAVEGASDAMIALLRRHLRDTRARPGCEGVTVHQDPDRPTSIVLVERWASRADDDAYRAAAREAKRGLRIDHVEVDKWKAEQKWLCADHPKGPPWWKGNGGNGKRPAEYVATPGLGL